MGGGIQKYVHFLGYKEAHCFCGLNYRKETWAGLQAMKAHYLKSSYKGIWFCGRHQVKSVAFPTQADSFGWPQGSQWEADKGAQI